MKTKDWVGLIEAGYCLEGDDEAWGKNILNHVSPILNNNNWPAIGIWQFTPTTIDLQHTITNGPKIVNTYLNEIAKANNKVIDIIFRGGPPVISLDEQVFPQFPNEKNTLVNNTLGQITDSKGLRAFSGTGMGIGLTLGFFKEPTPPTALEKKRWSLISSHWGAGLRLRTLAKNLNLEASQIEAVFDGGGKLHDARKEAKETSSQKALREAVCRIDKVRTQNGRSDPDSAMQAWEGLVQGRWSLVDYFDTDHRRFVVAIKNDPEHPDPRGLTTRERQIAEFTGLGQSSKQISYTLGVSQSAVTNCTARAQQKLGLSSLVELAAFFSPSGLRTKLAEVSLSGEELLVGTYPLVNENHITKLTEAERAVLAQLIAGSTNSDIAQRRNTSDRTVANQIQSIFHKLNVSSRSQLASRLQNAN